ncbi:MAG: efflux RND transporter permease subunit, partial [Candidatus Poribacteria bacterium]|nr:efflux RND transporter permease subunit [Candidatus Poribacteria bacterium]
RLTESDRDDIANVEQMLVKTQAGSLPLTELGTTTFRDGPTRLTRLDKQQLITVSANIAEGDLGSVVAAIQANIDKIDVPDGYKVVFGGQVEQQSEAFAEIFTALILAIILTYMLIGGILESFVHPITIMMTLPLGLIGASVALVTTGLSINLFSLMAIVMLVGIVVNNGILLLDYTGQLRQKGLGMRDALLEACPVRLRPIVMANLAIVTGMLPQALSPSGVAVVQASMATVMIGGVLISTVLTLFVVPVIYTMLDRFSPSPTPTTSAS